MSIQTIKEEVQKLDKAAQADLMHFMIELLAKEGNALSDEWEEELDKREKALRDGATKGMPARQFLANYLDK